MSTFPKRKKSEKQENLHNLIDNVLINNPQKSPTIIAQELNCGVNIVDARRSKLNLPKLDPYKHYKTLNEEQMKQIEDLFNKGDGSSVYAISRTMKISIDRVRRYLKEEGYDISDATEGPERRCYVIGEKKTINVAEMTKKLIQYSANKAGVSEEKFRELLKTKKSVRSFFLKCKEKYNGEIIYTN